MEIDFKKFKFSDENGEMQTKKGLNSNRFVLNSENSDFNANYYPVFEGMFICFYDISALEITSNSNENYENLMQFNYCVNGRIELDLEGGFNVCLKQDDFCLSKESSKMPFFFPTKKYNGITIYFDETMFYKQNKDLLKLFELDFLKLYDVFLQQHNTIILKASNELKTLMMALWENRANLTNFELKHSALEIIKVLINHSVSNKKTHTYYTKTQAQIAKRTEEILTTNISKHIPIKTLAEKFNISETGVKNYFKAVYGENISIYLRKYRMKKASQMLIETNLSVGEISSMIGYTKQGKFAELFRKQYSYSPLEYRRQKHLEKEKP